MTTSTDRKGPNIKAIVIISIGVALNTALAAQMAQWSYSWFPPQASSAAPYVDDLFALETAIGSFLWFCRVIGQLRVMHEAAPATVSCLASRFACSVSLRTAR